MLFLANCSCLSLERAYNVHMKQFINPWYDSRNELSPQKFEVADFPIASFDVIDCYEVLSEHQRPSILAVLNHKLALDQKGKGAYDRVVGQYVTVAGAQKALCPDTA